MRARFIDPLAQPLLVLGTEHVDELEELIALIVENHPQRIDNLWIERIGEDVLVTSGQGSGGPGKVGSFYGDIGRLKSVQASV